MSRLGDKVRRADGRLGALYWGAVTVVCALLALGCAWMAMNAFLHAEGGVQWAGLALGTLAALMFGVSARSAAKRRGLSEIFDE